MRLHIFVEGRSEEAFFKEWLPRFLPTAHTFKILPHQGKGRLSETLNSVPDPKRRGLLDQLPTKLRVYSHHVNSDTDRVLVLVDADDEDCRQLKQRLERCQQRCAPTLVVKFRIAVEETESFYLGEFRAIQRAYPQSNPKKLKEYIPDCVCGAWELFRDVIGYPSEIEDKPSWGRAMGKHLTADPQKIDENLSPSFRQLCHGILSLCGEAPA